MGKGSRERARRAAVRRPDRQTATIAFGVGPGHTHITCPECGTDLIDVLSGHAHSEHLQVVSHDIVCTACGAFIPSELTKVSENERRTIYARATADAAVIVQLMSDLWDRNVPAAQVADEIERADPSYKQFAEWLRQNQWAATMSGILLTPVVTTLLTMLLLGHSPSREQVTVIIEQQAPATTSGSVTPGPPQPIVDRPREELPAHPSPSGRSVSRSEGESDQEHHHH